MILFTLPSNDPYLSFAMMNLFADTVLNEKMPPGALFCQGFDNICLIKNLLHPANVFHYLKSKELGIPLVHMKYHHGSEGDGIIFQDMFFYLDVIQGDGNTSWNQKFKDMQNIAKSLGFDLTRSKHRPNANDFMIDSKKAGGSVCTQLESYVITYGGLNTSFDYNLAAELLTPLEYNLTPELLKEQITTIPVSLTEFSKAYVSFYQDKSFEVKDFPSILDQLDPYLDAQKDDSLYFGEKIGYSEAVQNARRS